MRKYFSIFLDECINGKSFLKLTQEDFNFLKIKMGPSKELLLIINNINAENNSVNTFSFCNFMFKKVQIKL